MNSILEYFCCCFCDVRLFNGYIKYTDDVAQFLEAHGTETPVKLIILRNPINQLLKTTLTCLSPETADFKTLYHLQIFIETDKKTRFILDKQASISVDTHLIIHPDCQFMAVSNTDASKAKNTTVFQMLENARLQMGDEKFFKYSAADSNCQDFMLGFITSNGITGEKYCDFVKQDTSEIFKDKEAVRKLANTLTDVDARVENMLDELNFK